MEKRLVFTGFLVIFSLVFLASFVSAGIFSKFFGQETGNAVSPLCGNGVLQAREKCDYGPLNGQPCTPQYVGDSCQYCDNSCQIVVVEGYPECGNGLIEIGEECDGGNYGGESMSCKAFGFPGGTLRCTSSCQFDFSSCTDYYDAKGEVNENFGHSCTETDGGFDIYTFGQLSSKENEGFFDYCLSAEVCQLHFGNDDCVLEGVCNSNGLLNTLTAECPGGYSCLNGACLKNPETESNEAEEDSVACTDTDGGLNYHVKGSVLGKASVDGNAGAFTDKCISGQEDYNLVEYGCGTLQESLVVGAVPYNYFCENGCTEGECISASSCVDNDGGRNYYVKGSVSDFSGQIVAEDFCENIAGSEGKILREYYSCHSFENVECGSGCVEGACKLNAIQKIVFFFMKNKK